MASLLLGDLNDYISPAQACTKPVAKDKTAAREPSAPVTINLNDCLACSGCITSAEAVLVFQQSHQQLHDVLALGEKRVIVTVSPQTRAALAARFRMSLMQVHRRLHYFFRRVLGTSLVLDSTFGRCLALAEMGREFVARFEEQRGDSGPGTRRLPMLTSACPGWICYAEKKQPGLLPLISTVRSPQQVMGALVKTYLADDRRERREEIFHVTVMPCYDKKLEASRKDFQSAADETQDVDCVITTSELLAMIDDRQLRFGELPEAELESEPFATWARDPGSGELRLLGHAGSAAGGYLAHVMCFAAKALFNIDLQGLHDPRVVVRAVRNEDYSEYVLTGGAEGAPLLRFAAVYGFRNIQTFIQKSKTGKAEYDFVEVMACPGACLFGGGQPAFAAADGSKTEYRQRLERLYQEEHLLDWPPAIRGQLDAIWRWIDEDRSSRAGLLHTQYRSLEETRPANRIVAVQW